MPMQMSQRHNLFTVSYNLALLYLKQNAIYMHCTLIRLTPRSFFLKRDYVALMKQMLGKIPEKLISIKADMKFKTRQLFVNQNFEIKIKFCRAVSVLILRSVDLFGWFLTETSTVGQNATENNLCTPVTKYIHKAYEKYFFKC